MKKLIFIVLAILPMLLKAPPISDDNKTIRTHYYWLQQEELRKEQQLTQFLFHLSLRESGNNWKIINRFGYFGYYQFGNAALKTIGFGHITTKKFRKNPNIFPPELQHIAVKKLLFYNAMILQKYNGYIGCTMDNVLITKSGMLAAAHLTGAGNVIKFLESDGKYDAADGNGIKTSGYLKEFKNYQF